MNKSKLCSICGVLFTIGGLSYDLGICDNCVRKGNNMADIPVERIYQDDTGLYGRSTAAVVSGITTTSSSSTSSSTTTTLPHG